MVALPLVVVSCERCAYLTVLYTEGQYMVMVSFLKGVNGVLHKAWVHNGVVNSARHALLSCPQRVDVTDGDLV